MPSQVLGQIFSAEAGRAFAREAERWIQQNEGKDNVAVIEVLPKTEGVAASEVFCKVAQHHLKSWLLRCDVQILNLHEKLCFQ